MVFYHMYYILSKQYTMYKNKCRKSYYSEGILTVTINRYAKKYGSEQNPGYNVMSNTKIVLRITYCL